MRKKLLIAMAILTAGSLVTACGNKNTNVSDTVSVTTEQAETADSTVSTDLTQAKAGSEKEYQDAVQIVLSDDGITVDGSAASEDESSAVYIANDIIYYEDRDTYDSGNAYGEGTDKDKHDASEAAAHTVVHITQPGTYYLTGTLSLGQIFVDAGEAVTDQVTLILDGVDITCTVAPAVMFYNVYECDADASEETASYEVDTSNAGAKVIIADGSVNNVSGSYVARIYKDNADKKKKHKYDGAFYSKMSMEISGGEKGDGVLNITAENEGLDTELHLTINGGIINILSADDGINVNEDGISVCTINGGTLNIQSTNGSEGDGIDSNGWIVINGGTIVSSANRTSQDAGIDSDMGIYINGGTVIASGNMYDEVEADSAADFMVLQFSDNLDGLIVITDENDNPVVSFDRLTGYTYAVISSEKISEGTYHVYSGGTLTQKDGVLSYEKGTQLAYTGNAAGGGMKPDMGGDFKGEQSEMQRNFEGGMKPDMGGDFKGERPEMPSMEEGASMPDDRKDFGGRGGANQNEISGEKQTDFVINAGANFFSGITAE